MEQRIRRAERRLNPDLPMAPEEVKDNLRGAFRRQSKVLRKYDDGENVKEVMGQKTHRTLIFLALLAVLLMWLVRSSAIKHLFGAFGFYF